MPNQTVSEAKPRDQFGLCLLLFVLTFIIYGGYIANDWIFDDHQLIVASDWYERPMQLGDLTADLAKPLCGREMSYWRPGQLLLYRMQHMAFGKNPAGWRFLAIFLHATVACLLMFVLHHFVKDRKLAFIAAALYLAHPAHSEVIGSNNISIPEGLFAVAGLLTLLKGRPVITALFAMMALSVRESAVIFPFVYVLFSLFYNGQSRKKLWLGAGLSIVAVAAMMMFRFFVLKHSLLSSPDPWPFFQRVGMSAYMIVKTTFLPFPSNLAIHHAPVAILAHVIAGWILIMLAILVIGGLSVKYRKTGAYEPLLFALAATLTIGPYMGVFSLNILFAQHYLYVPLAFAICCFVMLIGKHLSKWPVRISIAALMALFATISFQEAGTYRHDGVAFGDAARKYPTSETAFRNLAYHQFQSGDIEKAENSYRRVLELTRGKDKKSWNNLGDIYFKSGRFDLAEKCFRKAGQDGEFNLAVLLVDSGRFDEAMPLLVMLLADDPENPTLSAMMSVVKMSDLEN